MPLTEPEAFKRGEVRRERPDLVGAPEPPLWNDDGKPDEYELWWWANLPDDYHEMQTFD